MIEEDKPASDDGHDDSSRKSDARDNGKPAEDANAKTTGAGATGNDPPAQAKRTGSSISDETAEAVKRAILFGEAGYKQPPQQHRFQKGKSGNERGRPKSKLPPGIELSAAEEFLGELERPIAIRDGDEIRQVSTSKAIVRAQIANALKNQSAYSQKNLLDRFERARRARQMRIDNQIDCWSNYIAATREQMAKAIASGQEPPSLLPHPDDIEIDPGKGVRFTGPGDETTQKMMEDTLAVRDMLILQDGLDRALAPASEGGPPDRGPGSALLYASVLNQFVPKRCQLSDFEFTRRMMRNDGTPKRQLLKAVYRGWRKLGRHLPRGFRFPPIRKAKQDITLVGEITSRIREGSMDVLNSSIEELAAEIMEIYETMEVPE